MPDNSPGDPSASDSPSRPAPAIIIRLATADDLSAINDIYNHYVAHSTCTYQEEPEPMTGRQAWFERHGPGHPITVALDESGTVIGWGSLSPFHPRSAYRFTVENSVYLRPEARGKGVGSALLADLIHRARLAGYRSIIALIDADQIASVSLHRRFGFEPAGHLKKVGFKFGRWLDVAYLQLPL